ncbi:MAG: SIS domain-containing protein [Patescibacteria group bacterium]|jgi:glucose/mannose-6-phosphate isomerase
MDYDSLAQKHDSSNMLARIDEFLPEFKKAAQIGYGFEPTKEFMNAKRVIGLGMGGSGMGYTILSTLAKTDGKVPVEVVSDYHLPPYVNATDAVCVTSFSGNTEETLSAAEEARALGCPMVCITTGGKLAEWAKQYHISLLQFTYPVAPRVGLPYTLGIAYGVMLKAHFLPDSDNPKTLIDGAVTEVLAHWPVEKMKAETAEFAQKLVDKMVFVVGSGFSFAVGTRWKGQLNENAKIVAFIEPMPEMCHNMYLGYKLPLDIVKSSAVIFLDSHFDHPQNRKRVKLVGDEFSAAGALVLNPTFDQINSKLGLMLAQIIFGDYVSYYLALLNGEDPVEMDRIENLKKKLI